MKPDAKWEQQVQEVTPISCGRLDMCSYDVADEIAERFVYWEDAFPDGERTTVRGNRCDHVAYMAARYPSLIAEIADLRARIESLIDIQITTEESSEGEQS